MDIIQKPSPNFDDRGDAVPVLLMLHYTGMESAKAALERLTDPDAKVSSHYTVDEVGKIYQHVDEEKRAWHAGAGAWSNLTNINSHSIGIEIVNKGHEFGYEPFPEKQVTAVKELCLDVMKRNGLEAENVIAHSDAAPDRKQDPGELFPWEAFAKEGVGIWPNLSVEDTVKACAIDVYQALHDFGYRAKKQENALVAFQRRFVPEVFAQGEVGEVTSLTKGR
ncbi:MAG: N-acetylmuramoyl-L-alanine amidase, partial [Alphaproteobacteria bacterium]|nr:N-acetylmuramoyl-L-alanine amidase [Alphaproteobacteria bacterium]